MTGVLNLLWSASLPQGWSLTSLSDFRQSQSRTFNPAKHPEEAFDLYSVPSQATLTPEVVEGGKIGSNKQFVSPGNVLLSKINPKLNRTWVVGPVGSRTQIASTEWIVFETRSTICSKFLSYLLQTLPVRDFLCQNSAGVGGSLTRVRPDVVDRIFVPLPPLPEQHRIVARIEELFSELDDSEASLIRARAKLQLYRQSLLKAAFEGKLTADWRAANPDKLVPPETLLSRIRKDREARYATALQDWSAALTEWRNKREVGRKPVKPTPPAKMDGYRLEVVASDSGVASLPLGWFIDEPSYGTAKKCSYESEGFGVLRIPNISDGAIDPSDMKYAEFDEDEAETYRLEPGDVLVIRSNGSVSIVGTAAVVGPAHTDFLFAGYLIRLRPIQGLLNGRFLLRVLESHGLRKQIEEKAKSTSGVNNISAAELKDLSIPLFGRPEQELIETILDERLSVIDRTALEITTALNRIAALRQSILKRAFSGRLVAQNDTDEPAVTLLARIKSTPSPTPARRGRKARA